MQSKTIIVGSKNDVNANVIGSRPCQSKSPIDFENMLEKADLSRGKLADYDGTETSGEGILSGHLLTFGTKMVDENSRGNSSNGDVFSKSLEDFEITLEATEVDPDQDASIKNIQQTNGDIRLETKIGNRTRCAKDNAPDQRNEKFGVPMGGFVINEKVERLLLAGTNESAYGFKAQNERDQMEINTQSAVNGREKMQIDRRAMQEKFTLGSDVVVPINSATLYGELRRAIKQGDQLKKNNQQCELRNMELQGEVLEMSRMAAHYEAKSQRCSTREDELRNELNAAIKRATRYQKEVNMCKNKVGLIEGLFLDSEKRQALVKKKLEEAECKISTLETENEELNAKLKESISTTDSIQKAVSQKEATNETGHVNETKEQKEGDLRDELGKSPTCEHICYSEYEYKEYRFLISALKEQLKEANTINKRYGTQVMHQAMTIERLKMENIKLQGDIKDMKNNDRGRKGKAFLYLQQYRESQVQMQSINSGLKKERAENDDLKLQCKWMTKEIDRLKSALASKSSKGTQNQSNDSQEKMSVEDAKIIEGTTNFVEERTKFARSVPKGSPVYGLQSQIADDGKVCCDVSSSNIATGNKNQYDTLKDQHEKLSIEMALTRNTVKKLESDNSELRQQISLLKAEIALGFEGGQKDDSGGVIPGKYRRGNFEVVSKPTNDRSERQRSRRTQSMSGFRAMTRSLNTDYLERHDKAQSLIDLTKVSIDEVDERRSPLKKHNSEGEKIYEDKESLGNDKRQFTQSLNTARKDSLNKSEASNNSGFLKRPAPGQNTHTTLRPSTSFPYTDELSNFGNFKKAESASGDYHVFKVPGALRASPAAKSLNSFMYPSHENTSEHDHQSKYSHIDAQDYNYVAT